MMGDSVTDSVTREVLAKVDSELGAVRVRAEQVLSDTAARVETEARARLDAAVASIQLPAAVELEELPEFDLDGFDPIGWIKAQATSRALRTLAQGLLAVVLIAVGNVVAQSLANPDFDVLSWDDWKVVSALAGTAVLTGLISYLQNAFGIKPPKV